MNDSESMGDRRIKRSYFVDLNALYKKELYTKLDNFIRFQDTVQNLLFSNEEETEFELNLRVVPFLMNDGESMGDSKIKKLFFGRSQSALQ